MKIRMEKIDQGEEEILIRYKEMTKELNSMISLLNQQQKKLIGILNAEQHVLNPENIYYIESVDNAVFAYTREAVYRIHYSLNELESRYEDYGYFRCNKSAIINVYMINSLKSEMGNRINARLNNGEHIIISRRYAKELRAMLKKGSRREGE